MRITVGARVSTECWRFDGKCKVLENRWSYSIFGEDWVDGRLKGTVKARAGGNRWLVKWDIDDSETEISTENLVNEDSKSSPAEGNFYVSVVLLGSMTICTKYEHT